MADHDDHGVIRAVSEAFDAELPPIPNSAHLSALRAFGWRMVTESQLLELLTDTADDDLVGVRGSSTLRALTFTGAGTTVRVTIDRRILGVAVTPATSLECHLEHHAGESTVFRTSSDGNGTVPVDQLPVRLRLTTPTGELVTPWIIG